MEGSGVADAGWTANVGYLVIRGTCDYCNSTKSDFWHHYAALIAAAYARTVIERVHPHEPPPAITGAERFQSIPEQYPPEFELAPVRTATGPMAQAFRSPFVAPPRGEHFQPAPLGFVDASTNPDIGPEERVPASDVSQRIEADLDSYRILRVVDLSQTVRRLLFDSRLTDIESYCSDLERELQQLPRRGDEVAAGWTALAEVELRKAHLSKAAGQPFEHTRYSEFISEVEKCH